MCVLEVNDPSSRQHHTVPGSPEARTTAGRGEGARGRGKGGGESSHEVPQQLLEPLVVDKEVKHFDLGADQARLELIAHDDAELHGRQRSCGVGFFYSMDGGHRTTNLGTTREMGSEGDGAGGPLADGAHVLTVERRLFLGGIPPNATEQDIERRFSAFPTLSVSDVYVARVDAGRRAGRARRVPGSRGPRTRCGRRQGRAAVLQGPRPPAADIAARLLSFGTGGRRPRQRSPAQHWASSVKCIITQLRRKQCPGQQLFRGRGAPSGRPPVLDE